MHEHTRHYKEGNKQLEMANFTVGLYDWPRLFQRIAHLQLSRLALANKSIIEARERFLRTPCKVHAVNHAKQQLKTYHAVALKLTRRRI